MSREKPTNRRQGTVQVAKPMGLPGSGSDSGTVRDACPKCGHNHHPDSIASQLGACRACGSSLDPTYHPSQEPEVDPLRWLSL